MEYKGYAAAVSFDHDLSMFTGWVVDLQDEICFEGRTAERVAAKAARVR